MQLNFAEAHLLRQVKDIAWIVKVPILQSPIA